MKLTKKSIIYICQAVLALVALFLLFAPAIGYKNSDATTSGFKVIFGYDTTVINAKVRVLDASFGGIMTFIFIIAAIAIPCVMFFIKDKKIVFILNIVLTAIAVIAAVFLFLGTTDLMLNPATKNVSAADLNATLGAAFIIDAILFIFIGALSVVNQFVIKD
jgi:hypothetical protein